jgi:hypothetical protein
MGHEVEEGIWEMKGIRMKGRRNVGKEIKGGKS